MAVQTQQNNELSTKLEDKNNDTLLRDTICKGATPQEFELFKHVCVHTGLDPFLKQVYAVKRWNSTLRREEMTVQTSIDGYRLIADRTGKYAPGREPSYTYDEKGKVTSATAYIKKRTDDGTWHEVAACAYFDEYAQKTKDGTVTSMWAKMPRIMLAKCAESLALRKGFPYEMSALRTDEEMSQSEVKAREEDASLTSEQVEALEAIIDGDEEYVEKLLTWKKIANISQLPVQDYDKILNHAKNYQSTKKPVAKEEVIVPVTVITDEDPF